MGRAETPPAPTGLTAPETIVAAELPLAQKALNDIRKVNALEIEVGKLAQERGSSEEVKSFGKELVEDHQNADKKLVEFAMKNNVVLTGSTAAAGSERPTGLPSERDRPTGTGTAAAVDGNPPPVALDAKGKKEVAQLRAARGARFDRAFINAMVKGHTEAIDLLKSSKDKVNHGEFDSLLNDIQSSVEKHLEHAKQLQATSAGRAAAPAEERTMQGRRPPPPSPSQVPDPTMDPGRVPDPSRPDPARPEPTRLPDPSGIPDPSRAPGPTDPTSPSPTPSPTP
jgi:putative membrane protein